jgi:hypothetical protein
MRAYRQFLSPAQWKALFVIATPFMSSENPLSGNYSKKNDKNANSGVKPI